MFTKGLIRKIILLVLSGCAVNSISAQKIPGWELVWKDEFNYQGLPDNKKWGYETGHERNNEQQYYTNARKENIWVSNGALTITGRKELYPNGKYKPGSANWQTKDSLAQYTSASINTEGKASWLYGRVEVKAKLPSGGGIWPAIWMMGMNRKDIGWPFCGEIDIMEFVGNRPNEVYATMHYTDPGSKQHRSKGSKTTNATLNDSFHVYSVEWDEEKIDVYIDEKKYHTYHTDSAGRGSENSFRKPFYLLINLAMGAAWPGPIDEAVLPQRFVVDYVRVYKRTKEKKL